LLIDFGVNVLGSPVRGVQVWQAHLESLSAAQLEALKSTLDSAERARAARFHFEADRNQYVACRGLLRNVLAASLEKPAAAIVIEYEKYGKPVVPLAADGRALGFNISHSAGWAFFAIAWQRAVGIDLESAVGLNCDDDRLSALANRILSEREFSIWHSIPDSVSRRAAFLRAWTRKEAFAKAIGKGVFDQWRGMELVLDSGSPNSCATIASRAENGSATSWLIHDLFAPNGFAAALAVEQKDFL
jgi:4'-phosphopantetheinyl transferase